MARVLREESMKIVPPGKKRCVWMEAGVVSYKLCDNNYDCSTCVYDHAMQTKGCPTKGKHGNETCRGPTGKLEEKEWIKLAKAFLKSK